MKYLLLIGDGMSDRPLRELGGKTPLQTAAIPNMDKIAVRGTMGLLNNYPGRKFGMNSDVCVLNILGYDPALYYTGRGPLEAASMGLSLEESQIAFRCNLVTVDDKALLDYSAGHITSKEARVLMEELNGRFKGRGVLFCPGVSYRHLAVIDENSSVFAGLEIEKALCVPPHDAVGSPLEKAFPRGKGSGALRDLMDESRGILEKHEINYVRSQLNESLANMVWLWGQGREPKLPSFPIKGAVISAVDVVKGIAVCAGLKAVNVPGATGYYDTDYSAKAEYAAKALEDNDFVLVHLEAPDEAGHSGNIKEKISAIENFDRKIVGPLLETLESRGDFRVGVLPDHATPINVKNHATDPVPFAFCGSGADACSGAPFDEFSAKSTGIVISPGHKFMERFLS